MDCRSPSNARSMLENSLVGVLVMVRVQAGKGFIG